MSDILDSGLLDNDLVDSVLGDSGPPPYGTPAETLAFARTVPADPAVAAALHEQAQAVARDAVKAACTAVHAAHSVPAGPAVAAALHEQARAVARDAFKAACTAVSATADAAERRRLAGKIRIVGEQAWVLDPLRQRVWALHPGTHLAGYAAYEWRTRTYRLHLHHAGITERDWAGFTTLTSALEFALAFFTVPAATMTPALAGHADADGVVDKAAAVAAFEAGTLLPAS